jgi:hypothetical protein
LNTEGAYRKIEHRLHAIPNKLPPNPLVRVKVLRAMQVGAGRIADVGDVALLRLSDAQTLAALGRVELIG